MARTDIGDVAVAGEEDDRQGRVGAGELSLKVEAAQPREAHVEDKASRRIDSGSLQERLGAREDLDRKAHGGEEPPERVADGWVVVDRRRPRDPVELMPPRQRYAEGGVVAALPVVAESVPPAPR